MRAKGRRCAAQILDSLSTDSQKEVTLDWGRGTFAAGPHLLRFECMGKAEVSKGCFLGFDRLDVPTRAEERPAGFDLRKAQR